jgi:hypothetical protein
MNKQNQWLFEAPFVLEREHYTNLYANSEYYSNSEWEAEWETPIPKPAKSCQEIWTVWGFSANSATLLPFQKRHIKDIAKHLFNLFKRDSKGKKSSIEIQFSYEGHVDKNTDSANYKDLDSDRASEVAYELNNQLEKLYRNETFSMLLTHKYSQAGSTRHFSSDSKKNRRVVICAKWEIKIP